MPTLRTPRPTGARLVSALLALAILALATSAAAPTARAEVFPAEAVATDHPEASRAGLDMLARGGNAVDAAVAAAFALAVVRPESCGLGGGGFMLVYLAADGATPARTVALDYRERAPAAVTPDFFERRNPEDSRIGGAAVGVPGTVAGLFHALERFGTLDRATVLAPAIALAEHGFRTDEHYALAVASAATWFQAETSRPARFPFTYIRFLARGEPGVNATLRQWELSRTLALLARDGAPAFYRGPITDALVRAVRADGGVMTADDLAAFEVRELEPLRATAFARTILTMPPPSSGGLALLQTLATLERRPELRTLQPGTPLYLHLLAEAFKHAFADRARRMGDAPPETLRLDELLDPGELDRRARAIDPERTLPADAYGRPARVPDDAGTSHISVVDARGNAVACTETLNGDFGSFVTVDGYAFLLNNQLDDFQTRAGAPNQYALTQSDRNRPGPGKRPLSSMAPTIALEPAPGGGERVALVVGASGGPRIITAVTQVILNVLLFHAGAEEAVTAARIHHQWSPPDLRVEARADWSAARADLARRGHTIESINDVGAVQLITRVADGWDAASDPRKGGRPAGR